MARTRIDQHGAPITGSAEAVALYDAATDAWLRFSPGVVDLAGRLMTEHPVVPLGHALGAYLYLSSTDAPDVESA
jgi:hypothetical protein